VTVSQDRNNSGQIRRQECDRNSVEDLDGSDPGPGLKGLANFRKSESGSVISILDPEIKNIKNVHKNITKSESLSQFNKHDKLLFIIVSDCKSRGNNCKGRERL
jgi:hypothetical protein